MREKRKFRRVHMVYYLLVFKGDGDELAGHIVDVGEHGVKIVSRSSFSSGEVYNLRMVLPSEGEGRCREVVFKGKCAWCRDRQYGDFYGAGFQFQGMAEEDMATIRELVRRFGYIEDKGMPAE